MKYSKIALIGMPGCGKTKTAKIVSEKFNLVFLDTDEIFEKKFYTISDFFKNEGENKFREEENKILKEITKKNNFIISTGGGIILNPENRKILFCDDIITFYLKTSVEELSIRLSKDNSRPLLNGSASKIQSLKNLIDKRERYYTEANYTIITDSKSTNTVANEIIEILK